VCDINWVHVRLFTGVPAVVVTIPKETYSSVTLTNVLMSNGSIAYFGSDTNMYGTIKRSDTVQVYDLSLAGGLSVIAIKGALAMLEDGSIMLLSYYNKISLYIDGRQQYIIDSRPHPYTELGRGYTCPSVITVTASETNGLANAIAMLGVHSQYRYIELGAGTHHITHKLIFTSGADVIIRAEQNAIVVIDCSTVTGPCFSFTDNYSVTLQGLRIQTSSRRLDSTNDTDNDQHRKLLASNEGLRFTNVRVISLSDVVLQGFSGDTGSALYVECFTARCCSNVNVARVSFVDNAAVQNGGAVMLDVCVAGTVFNLDTVTFSGNTAQTGAALYWYVRPYTIYHAYQLIVVQLRITISSS
jgi:hypothetical protein